MNEQPVVYASVDLELTGFDPITDEIVEIGIVLFKVQAGKVFIEKEWQSLIKPQGSLHARIQGLTGITTEDLETAPEKDVVIPEVRALLQGAILVGHGVSLDRRFLEAIGVTMDTRMVDTLELAQIFLPTYHSYNLENLAHALEVNHTTAHRALSDAQATVGVLRSLIQLFWSLPNDFRERIVHVAARKSYAWLDLFMLVNAENAVAAVSLSEISSHLSFSDDPLPDAEGSMYLLPVARACAVPWARLAYDSQPWVVALSSREQVLEAARMGYATPFLGIAEALSETALAEAELAPENLQEREALAVLKILVWKAQWDGGAPLLAEINWSLLGTDFKKRFSEVRPFPRTASVVAVDYRSLAGVPKGWSVWVCETDKYIDWLEQQSGQVLSWQGVIHQLRQIYNPENGFGDKTKALEIQEAIAATDIFFATVLLLLKKHQGLSQGVVAQSELVPFMGGRLVQIGQNYAARVRRLDGLAGDKNIAKILGMVVHFFESPLSADELRWLEFADDRCVFIGRPLSLQETQRSLMSGFGKIIYTTDIPSGQVLNYIAARLSMGSVVSILPRKETAAPHLGVLSYETKEERDRAALHASRDKITYLLFPNQPALKSYYDAQYASMPHKQAVIAVGIHGGINKVLRNFRFGVKSTVLVTQQGLANFSAGGLSAQAVFYVGMPVIDVVHPYTAALVKKFFRSEVDAQLTFQIVGFSQSLRPFGTSIKDLKVAILILETEELSVKKILETWNENVS